MGSEELPRISMAATIAHLKLGGKKSGADRVAANAREPARNFAEQILTELGHISAQRAKEFGRKTLKKEDVEKAVIKISNYIKVGKSTLD